MQDVVGRIINTRLKLSFGDSGTCTAIWSAQVGVERRADERMRLDRFCLRSTPARRPECPIDAESARDWHDRMLADHLRRDSPDFRLLFSTSFLACLTVAGEARGVRRE
jgi:hypothetical protein